MKKKKTPTQTELLAAANEKLAKVNEIIKAANGEVTGKPSFNTLVGKVHNAIQGDERFATVNTGEVPCPCRPYCADILVPDDDGSMIAIIRTSEGKLVKHGFTWDGEDVTLEDGDSDETEMTTVYAKQIKDFDASVKAQEEAAKPKTPAAPREAVHARAASAEFDADPPKEFMWMPGGVTTIAATWREGKCIEVTVECDEDTVAAVQASFDKWKKTYPNQKPFGCVEHREEEAAFWPSGFRWNDTAEKTGIFCSVESWSELGDRNVRGKIHRSFSPSFTTDAEYDKAKENAEGVLQFPDGVRGSAGNPARVTGVSFSVGSLTNKPAFRNILPVRAKQAPQPDQPTNAETTKVKMKIKYIKARGTQAAGSTQELDDAEANKIIATGDALEFSVAERIEAQDAELKSMRDARKEQHKTTIKAKVAAAKKRLAIAGQDETEEAKIFARLEKTVDAKGNYSEEAIVMACEILDGMQPKADLVKAAEGNRITTATGPDKRPLVSSGITLQGVDLRDAGDAYVKAREPMNKLIRDGNFKEAFDISLKTSAIISAHFEPVIRAGGDFAFRDVVRAADFTDPDSQVGTLVTGLILQRNLGFLKNKLAWLPYLTTDMRNEPAKWKQPIFTRYITPPNILTYVPGIGYTSDAGTIAANSGETETSGTLTKSVPSATDVTVTIDQNKGVEIEFHTQKLGATMRNLFAEQQGAQFYSLAEEINKFVLAKIFAATWTAAVPSYTKALANWNLTGLVGIKNALSLDKVPDIGRFLLMHSVYHDKLLEDSNLVLANVILAAFNKETAASFQTGELPTLFGVKPLESQLSAATNGTLGSITDPANLGTINNVGFAGNMSSMVFVARIPQDYTAVASGMGIPATAAVEIVTEPDSGLSMMFVKYVNHTLASVSARCALMYGAAQGDPRVGVVLKAV